MNTDNSNCNSSATLEKLKVSYILNTSDVSDRPGDNICSLKPTTKEKEAKRHNPPSKPMVLADKWQEKRFLCLQCGHKFRTKGDFRKHFNIVHLGIRKHSCKSCGIRFGEKGNLTKHEKRHEGLRKHLCKFPNCQSSFVLRDGLTRHERTVHNYWP